MSACIRCGSAAGEEYRFAHVETNTVFENPKGGGRQKKTVTEKLLGAAHVSVCSSCAWKAKIKAILLTVPITLVMTLTLSFFSLFKAHPNRNIRKEVASAPTVLPMVAGILWMIGLSIYVPRPLAFYAAEIARKDKGWAKNTFLVPLDARYYIRRKDGEISLAKLMSKTPIRTELAQKLVPAILDESREAELEPLIGQEFTLENAR
ncbi:MAG: hypothetical protein IKN04_09285 [Clostridia bacterium]|nr:hypothetical protein [Clostridia bacterium]